MNPLQRLWVQLSAEGLIHVFEGLNDFENMRSNLTSYNNFGSVVKCFTRHREVAGLRRTGGTALCP